MKHLLKFLSLLLFAGGMMLASCGGSDDEEDDINPDIEKPDGGGTDTGKDDNDTNDTDTITMVDLGLSVKWADRNVGAKSCYEYGEYYNASAGSHGGALSTGHFVSQFANVYTGDGRLPKPSELYELFYKCKWETVVAPGGISQGSKVTGPNGNSIYIPYGGYKGTNINEGFHHKNTIGYYAYSPTGKYGTQAWTCSENSCDVKFEENMYKYLTVRLVSGKENPNFWDDYYGKIPSSDETVDLGLSVKWSPWNIGADAPEDYGGLYGWGDPTGKNKSDDADDYPWKEVKESICSTQYDIAHVQWGNKWRMPTYKEMEELHEKCTWEWVQQNTVYGYKVTGSNGNSIFLPAGGYRKGETLFMWQGSSGLYWTGVKNWIYSSWRPIHLSFTKSSVSIYPHGGLDFCYGLSIRPVTD